MGRMGNSMCRHGRTPLHYALLGGNIAVAKKLAAIPQRPPTLQGAASDLSGALGEPVNSPPMCWKPPLVRNQMSTMLSIATDGITIAVAGVPPSQFNASFFADHVFDGSTGLLKYWEAEVLEASDLLLVCIGLGIPSTLHKLLPGQSKVSKPNVPVRSRGRTDVSYSQCTCKASHDIHLMLLRPQ